MMYVRRIARTFVVLGACVVGSSCYSSSIAAPDAFQGITSVVLRAWEDTRVGLPPLAVTRQDSVAIVVDFINTRRNNWEQADATLPGNPLFAELRRGSVVVGRFGFIEISHGAGGYFITRDGNKDQLRPATAQEIAVFLAFFGIGVQLTPD
ncbi:MAG: hypothetical protein ACT4P6_12200 [Gemmatimonadaceae bacterium]